MNNCKEDDGDDEYEEDDNEIDNSGDDKKDDDGGDGDDNEIEEDNPNGNKSEKKGGQNRGIGEKRAVCSQWSRDACNKHPDKCENYYPQLCGKILRFGICTEKEECKRYHLKMCRNKRNTGICKFGERCYFRHQTEMPKNMKQEYGRYGNQQQGRQLTFNCQDSCFSSQTFMT